MKKKLFIILIYSFLLFLASIVPTFNTMNDNKIHFLFEIKIDYVFHFLAYFGFFLVILFFQLLHFTRFSFKDFSKTFIFILFFSFLTEFLQLFLSYRTFNPIDLLSNFLGIFFGSILYFFVNKISKITNTF